MTKVYKLLLCKALAKKKKKKKKKRKKEKKRKKQEYHENFVQRSTMKKKLEVYEKLQHFVLLHVYMFVNTPIQL